MIPSLIASIVLACLLCGALLGMRLRRVVPAHHLSEDSRDVVKLAMGLTATMTALVLGLVTASTKSAFDAQDTAVRHLATEMITLDRMLARYGPATHDIREALRRALESKVDSTWPEDRSRLTPMEVPAPTTGGEVIEDRIRALSPESDAQRWLQTQALEASSDVLHTRWFVFGAVGDSVPLLFLIILASWLTILFASFGLLAPGHATVVAALFLAALTVASAIFLILEMDKPFDGLIKISDAPMRYALSNLGK